MSSDAGIDSESDATLPGTFEKLNVHVISCIEISKRDGKLKEEEMIHAFHHASLRHSSILELNFTSCCLLTYLHFSNSSSSGRTGSR